MENTVVELYQFQMKYLKKLMENISDNILYEKQQEGFNSPGWIIGHLVVEAEDVFHDLGISNEIYPEWDSYFKNTKGKIDASSNLPKKNELMNLVESRYEHLIQEYKKLSPEKRAGKHPSDFLRGFYSTYDAWFAHHLTTHLAIHCGNIVYWKKMMGIEVNGY